LVSRLDDEAGREIRERALDSTSLGVAKQARNRELADMDGFIEPRLWTGVGRARSGCGAALVGSADQILSEIDAYRKMGMRSFIGKLVLPELKTCSLPHEYGRVPAATPATPLGVGDRH
ncbi:MAG: alkanesulfonate monooxygenase, partial [Pseudomonadota bacterium]|nr:alkanesulfonate monooxygenase [Pseudomonadota bacterium]